MRAELPTGFVTMLMTDIEGSTALVQQLGDGYRQVIDGVWSVLRTTTERRGGATVETRADEFFAVFASPADAVMTAVAIQRELAEREARCANELEATESRLEAVLDGIKKHQTERSARGNERDEAQGRRQNLAERRSDLAPRRARVESRLSILEEQRERHEGFDAAVRWILERRAELPGIVGVVGEEVRLFREQSQLGQALLGDAVSWVLVESVDAAWDLVLEVATPRTPPRSELANVLQSVRSRVTVAEPA